MVIELDLKNHFVFRFEIVSFLWVLGLQSLLVFVFIFTFKVFDRNQYFMNEIKEAIEIAVGVYTANVSSTLEQFLKLELHVLVEIKLL